MTFDFAFRMIRRSLVNRFRASMVTFLGVASAVACLVVLSSIMVGVGDAMIANTVAIHTGHVHVDWPLESPPVENLKHRIDAWPHVRTALWRKHREGVLTSEKGETSVVTYAVEPNRERSESVIPLKVIRGDYLRSPGGILLGSQAAETLGVGLGDPVDFRRIGDETVSYRVTGLFHTTIEPLDHHTTFVRFADLPGPASELAVYLDTPRATEAVAQGLRTLLPNTARVRTWRQELPELVQLISLNGVSMGIVLILALLILAFGVSNTVFISINERTREFGILKAMGVRPSQTALLVLVETLIFACSAGLAGVGVGTMISAVWSRIGLDLGLWTSANQHFVASGVIYPRITAGALVLPLLVSAVCSILAALLPAQRAGRINVVAALRSL